MYELVYMRPYTVMYILPSATSPYPPKPGFEPPKTGVVTFESTESSILGDQISNEIFSARKSFKLIRWIL